MVVLFVRLHRGLGGLGLYRSPIAALALAMPSVAEAATQVSIPATVTGGGSGALYIIDTASTGTINLSSYLTDTSGNKLTLSNLTIAFNSYSARDARTSLLFGDNPHYAYRTGTYRCGLLGTRICSRTVAYVDYTLQSMFITIARSGS